MDGHPIRKALTLPERNYVRLLSSLTLDPSKGIQVAAAISGYKGDSGGTWFPPLKPCGSKRFGDMRDGGWPFK